jgi:hypothetical protein
MQQIILNVEDGKASTVLDIINNLKSDLIKSCTLTSIEMDDDQEQTEIKQMLDSRSSEDKEVSYSKNVTIDI